MLLPSALPLALGAPVPSILLAAEVPGAQPVDIFYIAGVLGVAAFGARQVFDSAFPENTDEYVPPLAGSLPGPLASIFGGKDASIPPAERAEKLRARLQAAAEEGDIEVAYRLEKELKNLMAETGIRFVVDDQFQRSEDEEALPPRW